MTKIMRYELKRLLWNKFFAGLLAVTLLYGWQVLTGETLLGVARTAPFSPWSFGSYLGRLLPLLWVGTLFFLRFFTSEAALRTAVLTDATPADRRAYALTRCAAALVGAVLLTTAVLLLAGAFYSRYFRWHDWAALAPAAVVTLLPPLVFALGSGWALAGLRPWLLYVWMPVPLILAALPLPEALGLWNGSLFSTYPLTLETLDPGFQLPWSVWLAQGLLLAAGLALMTIRVSGRRR